MITSTILDIPQGDTINFTFASEQSPRGSNYSTILVVDDEPINRFIIKSFCDRLNLRTECASDGQEALELIRSSLIPIGSSCLQKFRTPFKAIILDYQMPSMSGPELLKNLKADQTIMTPPILGYTAYISCIELQYFVECGAVGILEKPATFEMFRWLMDKYC